MYDSICLSHSERTTYVKETRVLSAPGLTPLGLEYAYFETQLRSLLNKGHDKRQHTIFGTGTESNQPKGKQQKRQTKQVLGSGTESNKTKQKRKKRKKTGVPNKVLGTGTDSKKRQEQQEKKERKK